MLRQWESGREVIYPQLEAGDGYQNEIDYFIGCLRDRRDPETVTLHEAAESLRLALKCKESLDRDREVKWDE